MEKFVKQFAIVVVFISSIVSATSVFASPGHVPVLINVVLDASGSVSERDFHKANELVKQFAASLYKLAEAHPGELSDWLSVNWFGGVERDGAYQGTRFINCSKLVDMALLATMLENKAHPEFGYTEIYSAIGRASLEVLKFEEQLPASYLKLVILVTDGKDTSSSAEMKRLIKQVYPNDEVLLFIIGVGNGADIREFRSFTDNVVNIENFDQLLTQLIAARELVSLVANTSY